MRTNLLPALFDTAEPLQSILQRFEVDVHELLEYFDDHANLAHLQRLAAFTNRRTRMLLANLKLKALGVLDRVISGDPTVTEPVRKAASQILRTREEHLAIPIDDDTDTNTESHTETTPTHEPAQPINSTEPADIADPADLDPHTDATPFDHESTPAPAPVALEPVTLRIATDAPVTPRYPVAPVERRTPSASGARTRSRFKKRKR